jgi:hypothetical protein
MGLKHKMIVGNTTNLGNTNIQSSPDSELLYFIQAMLATTKVIDTDYKGYMDINYNSGWGKRNMLSDIMRIKIMK